MLEVWNGVIEQMLVVSTHALERWRERTGLTKVDISKPLSLAVPFGAQFGDKSFLLKYDDAVFPIKKVGRYGHRNVVCTTLTAAQAAANIEMYGNWHADCPRQERMTTTLPVIAVSEPDNPPPTWAGLHTYQGLRKRKAKKVPIAEWEQLHNLIQALGKVPDAELARLESSPQSGFLLNVVQSERGRRKKLRRATVHAQSQETEAYALRAAAREFLSDEQMQLLFTRANELRDEKVAQLKSEGRWLMSNPPSVERE